MANTLKTIDKITQEACYLLENELSFTKKLDNRSDEFGENSGGSVRIRKPINLETVQANDVTGSIRDIVEDNVTLTIDSTPISIPISISDYELGLSMEKLSDRVLKPAMESLASKVESSIISRLIYGVNNVVNSATPDFALTNTLNTRLDEKLCPKERIALLTSGQAASLRNDVKSLYTAPESILKQGFIGQINGLNILQSQLLPSFTTGSRTATGHSVTTATTPANGDTSIAITLGTSTTIKKGDTFTIAGVYNVNWYTKDTMSTLYQFTAAADVGAGTAVTVTLSEPIYGPSATGFRQRMSKLPVAGYAVSFVGAASTSGIAQGLIFNPKFASVAFLDLPVHDDVKGSTETYKGIKLRVQRQTNVGTNTNLFRIDVQIGTQLVQPEYACRVLSIA